MTVSLANVRARLRRGGLAHPARRRAGCRWCGGQDAEAAFVPWRTRSTASDAFLATRCSDSRHRPLGGRPGKPGLASASARTSSLAALEGRHKGSDTVRRDAAHWGVEGQAGPEAPAKDLAERLVEPAPTWWSVATPDVLPGSATSTAPTSATASATSSSTPAGGGRPQSGVLTLTLQGASPTPAGPGHAVRAHHPAQPLAAERARASQAVLRDCTGLDAACSRVRLPTHASAHHAARAAGTWRRPDSGTDQCRRRPARRASADVLRAPARRAAAWPTRGAIPP